MPGVDVELEERTIQVNRVAKVVAGGRRFSFTALMVVGDGAGHVGLGYGKAKEAGLAVQKGLEDARRSMFEVALAGSTIVHPVIGKAGAGKVLLKPASPGTGVIAGGAARAILELAGIHDILAKSLGSSNAINVAHATIAGLKALRRPEHIARARGKELAEIAPAGLLRAYRGETDEVGESSRVSLEAPQSLGVTEVSKTEERQPGEVTEERQPGEIAQASSDTPEEPQAQAASAEPESAPSALEPNALSDATEEELVQRESAQLVGSQEFSSEEASDE
jgi:small subunit ribosomal protein S5